VVCFQDSLISVLKMVMVPSLSALSEDVSRSVISGVIYGSAMVGYLIKPSVMDNNYYLRLDF
jgi:ribonuclease P/MRP protein subunit POP1